MGFSKLDGFQSMLKIKYGNIFRAWKEGLDTDGSGKLSFGEFCTAVRKIGYCGSVQLLWDALSREEEGVVGKFIELQDIAPEEGKLMESFRSALLELHGGSYIRAWKETLDTNKSGHVSCEQIQEVMRSINFPQPRKDAKKIFEFLDYDHSGFLTLEELDPYAYECVLRGDDVVFGDDCDVKSKGPMSMSFHERQGSHPIFIRKRAAGSPFASAAS